MNHLDAVSEEDDHEAEDDEDDQEAEDDDEDDDQHDEDEQPDEEDEEGSDSDDDDGQLWEIFYQGLKAGKKLNSASKGWNKPKGRGKGGHGRPSTTSSSSSNVTTVKKEKTGKCLDCGQFGHWKGDPECSRVKSGQTPLFKKHGTNVLYYNIGDKDYNHDEERTTVTPLNSIDPDEVLDWTPAEKDEEVTDWYPNPRTESTPWVL